ncbi:hypothetical protein CABS03_02951 [Colletotrichum abscissum]|uniref:Uncharacterized protein n=1 Tax=Colletotrichum abscissum TaxID=1671311 RepID=A0A9P9XL82_9PEZI|nr:hypothetical protein CABS02_04257 [Colletotrichum abscissum]
MSDNKQGGKWSNPAFLLSLAVGFYDELKNGSLPQEAKDRVEAKLHRDGFEDTTWDSVRAPILPAPTSFPDTNLFFHIPSIIPHQPTQYYTNIITMSEKSAPGGKWANPALLEALAMGFHTVAKGEGLTKEAKDAVILKIHAYGFTDITWEAVRCVSPCSLFHSGSCLLPHPALPLFISHLVLLRLFLLFHLPFLILNPIHTKLYQLFTLLHIIITSFLSISPTAL